MYCTRLYRGSRFIQTLVEDEGGGGGVVVEIFRPKTLRHTCHERPHQKDDVVIGLSTKDIYPGILMDTNVERDIYNFHASVPHLFIRCLIQAL